MSRRSCVVPLNIELTDIITPKLCSSYIAEIIKYAAYSKQQIPYPYERLRMFVLKRRERQKAKDKMSDGIDEMGGANRVAILMEKYFKKVEEAYEVLDRTFKCIERELMKSSQCPVEEVVLLFGATPVSPKDVFRFKIPPLCQGHSDAQHLMKGQIANLFRGIIVSDEVNANLQRRVGLTNMFVMLKTRKGCDSEWLLPKDQYKLSERAQQVCFTFRTLSSKPCMCYIKENQFEVLSQSIAALELRENIVSFESESNEGVAVESADQFMWFQAPRPLRGFKDCKSQGRSITDCWYKHKFI